MLLYVLRNTLPPLLRRNRLATMNSLGSLRLPPFLLSPLAHEARGGPERDSSLNLNCNDSPGRGTIVGLVARAGLVRRGGEESGDARRDTVERSGRDDRLVGEREYLTCKAIQQQSCFILLTLNLIFLKHYGKNCSYGPSKVHVRQNLRAF